MPDQVADSMFIGKPKPIQYSQCIIYFAQIQGHYIEDTVMK